MIEAGTRTDKAAARAALSAGGTHSDGADEPVTCAGMCAPPRFNGLATYGVSYNPRARVAWRDLGCRKDPTAMTVVLECRHCHLGIFVIEEGLLHPTGWRPSRSWVSGHGLKLVN